MKKQLQQLNLNHLLAVFLASMFGSLSLTALLQYATQPGTMLALDVRIALTLVGIAIYAAVVWLTFYLLVPEYRPALLRIVGHK